jgi:hypothetical protein
MSRRLALRIDFGEKQLLWGGDGVAVVSVHGLGVNERSIGQEMGLVGAGNHHVQNRLIPGGTSH